MDTISSTGLLRSRMIEETMEGDIRISFNRDSVIGGRSDKDSLDGSSVEHCAFEHNILFYQ